MSKNGILGIAAVILLAVAAVLTYQIWNVREQISEEPPTAVVPAPVVDAAPTSVEPPPVETAPLVSAPVEQPDAPPPAVAVLSPAEQAARNLVDRAGTNPRALARWREELNTLPSWLDLSDAQKDAMTPHWSMQMTSFRPGPIATTAALAIQEYERQRKQEAERQIEQILGPDLHARWREYQDTAEARLLLRHLNGQLGPQALPEETVRVLATDIRKATRQLEEEIQASEEANRRREPSIAYLDEQQHNYRRLNELMREALVPSLTPQQLQALDETQKMRIQGSERSQMRTRAAIEARAAAKAEQSSN